jgi:hypothetical protein
MLKSPSILILHEGHSQAVGFIGFEHPGQMTLLISNPHLLFLQAEYGIG